MLVLYASHLLCFEATVSPGKEISVESLNWSDVTFGWGLSYRLVTLGVQLELFHQVKSRSIQIPDQILFSKCENRPKIFKNLSWFGKEKPIAMSAGSLPLECQEIANVHRFYRKTFFYESSRKRIVVKFLPDFLLINWLNTTKRFSRKDTCHRR